MKHFFRFSDSNETLISMSKYKYWKLQYRRGKQNTKSRKYRIVKFKLYTNYYIIQNQEVTNKKNNLICLKKILFSSYKK